MSRSRDAKSTHWFVRITYPHAELSNKLMMFPTMSDQYLIVSHVGEKNDREHIHIAIVLLQECTKQTLDNRLKKIFPVKGSDYSSKIWDGKTEALSYMFHDANHKVVSFLGYTEEDLHEYRELNAKVQAVVEINKQRAPGRKVDGLVEKFRNDVDISSRYDIGMEVIRMIQAGEMYEPGDWKLKAIIEEVYMKLHVKTEDFRNYATARLNNLYR